MYLFWNSVKPITEEHIEKSVATKKTYREHFLDTFQLKEPVWGYRFVLTGDFDGDGKEDTLRERYVDVATNQETNKFYENVTYVSDYQIVNSVKRKVKAYLDADFLTKDTFLVGDLGIAWAETIGDINGNGRDEIGIVNMYSDFSNLNRYDIYTLDTVWKSLYSFGVNEMYLPIKPLISLEDTSKSSSILSKDSIETIKKEESEIQQIKIVELLEKNYIQYTEYIGTEHNEIYYIGETDTNGVWVTRDNLTDQIASQSILLSFEDYGDEVKIKTMIGSEGKELSDFSIPGTAHKIRVKLYSNSQP